MQDGYRILGSGKSGKMAKIYQHHKFPPCLGNPSMGERTRRILHTFSDITARWISSHSQRVRFTFFLDSIRMFREGIKKSIRQKRASQEGWLLANGRKGKGMGEYALKVSSAWVVRPTSCSIYRPTSNRGRAPQRGCSTSVLDSVRWSQPSTVPKALALP